MDDLTGHLSERRYLPYWNGTSLEFIEQHVPQRGQGLFEAEKELGIKRWKMYDELTNSADWYTTIEDDVERVIANEGLTYPNSVIFIEGSRDFFLSTVQIGAGTNTVPDSAISNTHRSVGIDSYVRPTGPAGDPLVISGWVRMHKVDTNETNHGPKLTFFSEDNNVNLYIYLLSTAAAFPITPNALRIFKEDRTGGTAPTFGETIGVSTTFTTWDLTTRYHFDVVLTHNEVIVYMEGNEVLRTPETDIRVGTVGWRCDHTWADFGDMVVYGGEEG